ncbi:MAG: primosomal protein N', partial [Sarcina sp.]
NYQGFFDKEINIRRIMNYPPFTQLLLITLTSNKENQLINFSKKLKLKLDKHLKSIENIEIYPACSCPIGKINNTYRWQILIKGNLNDIINSNIKKIVYEYSKDIYNEIRVSLDVNPNSLI